MKKGSVKERPWIKVLKVWKMQLDSIKTKVR